MFYIVLGALTFERNIFWRLCTGRRRRDEEEEEEEEEAIAIIGGRCWLMRDVVFRFFWHASVRGRSKRNYWNRKLTEFFPFSIFVISNFYWRKPFATQGV